jgi:PEGA domain
MGLPMNFANLRSKTSLIVLSVAVSATLMATDAAAQRRGGGGGGRPAGGGGRPMGQAVARGPVVRGGGRVVVGAPFRGAYYRPYYRGFYGGYGYGWPSFSLGFYAGYPFYGYGYYGYPYYYPSYPSYPYYGYPYGYPYPGYPYAGSNPYPAGYGYGAGAAYSGVRIEGAMPNAEVVADGTSVGIVDDFDGANQRLELTPGSHSIEIRMPGVAPVVYDVNVQPGRTVTLHVR